MEDARNRTGRNGYPKNYWKNICAIQAKQTKKGIENYGQRLEENTKLDALMTLTYLEEELIDGLMYIEHFKAQLWGNGND